VRRPCRKSWSLRQASSARPRAVRRRCRPRPHRRIGGNSFKEIITFASEAKKSHRGGAETRRKPGGRSQRRQAHELVPPRWAPILWDAYPPLPARWRSPSGWANLFCSFTRQFPAGLFSIAPGGAGSCPPGLFYPQARAAALHDFLKLNRARRRWLLPTRPFLSAGEGACAPRFFEAQSRQAALAPAHPFFLSAGEGACAPRFFEAQSRLAALAPAHPFFYPQARAPALHDFLKAQSRQAALAPAYPAFFIRRRGRLRSTIFEAQSRQAALAPAHPFFLRASAPPW
jgi:hypothetical protein